MRTRAREAAQVIAVGALAACGPRAARAPATPAGAVEITVVLEAGGEPPFVVVQEGEGAWRAVECEPRGCTIPVAPGRYGVAVACGTDPEVRYASVVQATTAEATTVTLGGCLGDVGARVHGVITGRGEREVRVVGLSWPEALGEGGTFQALADRDAPAIAVLEGRGVGRTWRTERVAIRRGLPAGEAGIEVDLAGAVATTRVPVTVTGLDEREFCAVAATWWTGPTAMVTVSEDTSRPFEIDRVPDALVASTDRLRIVARAYDHDVHRSAGSPTPALALPAPFGAASATALDGEPPRLAYAWDPYDGAAWYVLRAGQSTIPELDTDDPLRDVSWVVSLSRGWLGDRTAYELPAIAVEGWPASVALARGVDTDWYVMASPVFARDADPTYREAAWSTWRSGQLVP